MDNTTFQDLPPEEQAAVYFEKDGKKYVYDFKLITIIQAEIAKEIGEFKHYQDLKEASTIKEIIQSRSPEWLSMIMSYLLVKVANGAPCAFNEGDVTETEAFVKSLLTQSEMGRLEMCVQNFFDGSGMRELGLQILQGRQKRQLNPMQLALVSTILSETFRNSKPLIDAIASKQSTDPENLSEESEKQG